MYSLTLVFGMERLPLCQSFLPQYDRTFDKIYDRLSIQHDQVQIFCPFLDTNKCLLILVLGMERISLCR